MTNQAHSSPLGTPRSQANSDTSDPWELDHLLDSDEVRTSFYPHLRSVFISFVGQHRGIKRGTLDGRTCLNLTQN
ncbi:unnamed protein product [Gongylonema pulchrum]|uniref:Uncharacterized protein n=1 Tax=Gongylonema pulchrum TaxID=637853 RepID=A0A183DZL2_9BILA|nr:unnamed protein product [Gongylonema pulchrum]